jgi:multidrug resistance efflux pump
MANLTEDRPMVKESAENRPDTPATTPRKGVPRRLLLPIGFVALLAIAGFAYRTWYNSSHFVWTDNAQVSGAIIQVGALNAGRVAAVTTNVGETVQAGQEIARIDVPQPIAVTSSGTPKLGFVDAQNQQAEVTSPLTGAVVARLIEPGSTVVAGQAIISVVDPARLYVTANVNETDAERIKAGEAVDVSVDSLGITLPGRVEAITPASAGTFSLLPQANTSGSFTKVVQVIPVKIAVAYGNLPLLVGSSVEVNIHTSAD